MKVYISTSGIKRLAISNTSGAGKGLPTETETTRTRRISSRTVLPVVLVLAIFLPFLFVRIAFLVLESAPACSSTLDCIGWRFFSGTDSSLKLREELTRALLEAKEVNINNEEGIQSFNELVKEMTSKRQDIKTFAYKTKAMISRMERKIQSARQRESIYWHFASHGVPKSLQCLSLKLAEEYAVNAMARSRLPPPEYVTRISDPSFHHIVLLTDNILAASVVVSSTIQNSANPERLVFHIVTDKQTYTPMHAWFAINSIKEAVVEVKGLHQYDWSRDVNVGVKEMLEIQRLIWRYYYNNLKEEDFEYHVEHKRQLEALSPSCLSLMNHLRIYIPEVIILILQSPLPLKNDDVLCEFVMISCNFHGATQLFPDLNKIVLLDDDVVVQHDISSLWEMDLKERVVGAVVDSWCGDNCCPGRKYKEYFNFTHPLISSNFEPERCAWLYGINVFDLVAWRRSNITSTYQNWLKLSLKAGLALWYPGVIPPTLIAFEGQVHPIDPSFNVDSLGYRRPIVPREFIEGAVVVHFSGPAKPWLEIGIPEVRNLWNKHVNCSNKFIRKCKIMG